MVLSPNDFKLVASVSKQDEGLEGVSHSCSAGQFYPPAGQYNPPLGTNTPHMAPLMDEGIHSVKTLFQFLWSSSLLKFADSKIWHLHDVCVRISNKLNCWICLKKIICLKRILSTPGCTIELLSLYSLQDISLTILLPSYPCLLWMNLKTAHRLPWPPLSWSPSSSPWPWWRACWARPRPWRWKPVTAMASEPLPALSLSPTSSTLTTSRFHSISYLAK